MIYIHIFQMSLLLSYVMKKPTNSLGNFLLEFSILVLPSLVCFCYPECSWPVIIFMGFCALVLGLKRDCFLWLNLSTNRVYNSESVNPRHKKLAFDGPRASVIMSTCIAILAVDFNVFPNGFAKTEWFGFSLMDVGVGVFVTVNAGGQSLYLDKSNGHWSQHVKHILSAAPLVVLGVLRLIFTKMLDYKVSVGEYGVHWNFFFTLFGIVLFGKIFTALCWKLKKIMRVGIHIAHIFVGLLILFVHQWLLEHYNVFQFALNNPRETFFEQNFEGIISLPGYSALMLIMLGSCYTLAKAFGGNTDYEIIVASRRAMRLSLFQVIIWITLAVVSCYYYPPSRRLVNCSYVICIVAYSFIQMSSVILIQSIVRPTIMAQQFISDISADMLGVFLIANLLTGAVNMTIDTHAQSNPVAMAILFCYLFVLFGVLRIYRSKNIRLKFW
eukprot:TRINITY_DN8294_c0_g1_i1.p1 TRINITY_DN8294_c0_g1~~TRINITY_DN8294_c0_g1_i1.p1  ORF type:complete len:441 (-),score=58.33 TRINITY_DN8294_c0_g1_i1:55-1377(-)